jgi:hypothetical protein
MTDDLPPPAEELLRDHSCDDDDLPDLPTEASCADDDDGERVARISSIDGPGGASSTADSNIPAATLRVFKDDDGAVHSQHTSGVDSIV